MSKLYGRITYDHHAGNVTRTAHRNIQTRTETWKAIITVGLDKDGECEVTLTDKHGNNRRTLWKGNADKAASGRTEIMAYCPHCDATTTTENGQCLECGTAREDPQAEYTGSDGRIMKHCPRHRRIMTHVNGQCLACQEEARS